MSDLITITRAQYVSDIRAARVEALREAAEAIANAGPSAKFAPGWLAAEMGLRSRAAAIERGDL